MNTTKYHITDQTIILNDLESRMLHLFSGVYKRHSITKESSKEFYDQLKKLIAHTLWGLPPGDCRDSDVYQLVFKLWSKIIPPDKFCQMALEKAQYIYGLGKLKLYYSEDIPIHLQDCTCMISQMLAEPFAEKRSDCENEYNLIYLVKKPSTDMPFEIDQELIRHKVVIDSRTSTKEVTIKRSRPEWWYQNKLNNKYLVQTCLYQGDFKDIEFIGSKPSNEPDSYYKVVDGEYKGCLIYKYDTAEW